MRPLVFKFRWLILFGIIAVIIALTVLENDYRVDYDRSMENHSNADRYQNEAIKYVELDDAGIINQMRSILHSAPPGINPESQAWKIWAINYWVATHVSYVEDPPGDHYKPAHEILETRFGDCDDFSILLVSLFESAGLDAALVVLNTDDDPGVDIAIENPRFSKFISSCFVNNDISILV